MTEAATSFDTATNGDRFSKWPLYSGLVILAISCFLFYWPVTQIAFSIIIFLWAPPFTLVVLCLLVITVCCGSVALCQRQWRRSLSVFVFPVMLPVAIPAAFATDHATNWLTFAVSKNRYVADIQQVTKSGKHLLLWDWGGNVMIGFNRFIVWDPEDQLPLPKGQQTDSWKMQAQFPVAEYRVVQKLGAHFYLVETP